MKTNITKLCYIVAKTMTKYLDLLIRHYIFLIEPALDRHGLQPRDNVIASEARQSRVFHAENITKASMHTNATKSHYAVAKTMAKYLDLLIRHYLFLIEPTLDRHGLQPSHAIRRFSAYISWGCQSLVRDDVIASEARQPRFFHAEAIIKASMHTTAAKTRYAAVRTTINFNKKTIIAMEASQS